MLIAEVDTDWLENLNIVCTVVYLLATLLNIYLIIVVSLTRFNQLPAKCLFFTQALINICIAFTVVLYYSFNWTISPNHYYQSPLSCYIWYSNWPLFLLLALSSLNLLAQTIDRFMAILTPIFYSQHPRVRMIVMYSFIVIFGLLLSFVVSYGIDYHDGYCVHERDYKVYLAISIFWLSGIFFVPVIINCILIVLISRKSIQYRFEAIKSRLGSIGGGGGEGARKRLSVVSGDARRSDKGMNRVTKTVIVTVLIQSICYAPDSVYYLYCTINPRDYIVGSPVQVFVSTLMIVTSLLIPCLHLTMMRNLQRTSRRTMKRLVKACYRRHSTETNGGDGESINQTTQRSSTLATSDWSEG